ncbi:MAG: ATP-dependent 6-phosphofructokinase [Spiroplasma sp.]|nr:ATP-dependent 6-phosphofructokinase [Spiroplasma sp.]
MGEMNKKRKIAILTSGGDAPGMNNVINAVYKTIKAINSEKQTNKNLSPEEKKPWELLLIKDGYQGILKKEIFEIDDHWKESIINSIKIGGTIIGSARFKSFEEEETRKKAKKILDDFGVGILIAVGGDGTFTGLQKLSELGIQCIGIPGTIDNDVISTDIAIGFDTALNSIVEAIDRVRDTSNSHSRISIIEVMGRHCGDLAIRAAVNCDLVATPGNPKIPEHELINIVKDLHHKQNLKSIVVLVTENLYDVKKLARNIEQELKVETRATVLGQIQRGGAPTAADRYLATMMGIFAAEQIEKKGNSSIIIALRGNQLEPLPIHVALSMSRPERVAAVSKILRLSGIFYRK